MSLQNYFIHFQPHAEKINAQPWRQTSHRTIGSAPLLDGQRSCVVVQSQPSPQTSAIYLPVEYCNFFGGVGRNRIYRSISFTPIIYNYTITHKFSEEPPFGIYCILQLNHYIITVIQSFIHTWLFTFSPLDIKKISRNIYKKNKKSCNRLNVWRLNELMEH